MYLLKFSSLSLQGVIYVSKDYLAHGYSKFDHYGRESNLQTLGKLADA